MRRRRYLLYPAALVVFVWAEVGIVRVAMPLATHADGASDRNLISNKKALETTKTTPIADQYSFTR